MKKFYLTFLIFVSTNLLAYDPPIMGWSSWNTYRVNISDSLIMKQAKAMVNKGLKDVGYKYINIDDGYFGGRSLSGDIITHPERFPYGLKPTVDYIHALGLNAGIYTDAGRNTCGSFWDKDLSGIGVGMYGNEWVDATLFFKDLGFDFIKIDFCGGDAKQNFDNLNLDAKERYTQIKDVISNVTDKKVVLNVCRWNFPGTWVCEVGDSWRISPDINPSWRSVKNIISQNLYLSAYAGGGHYNDMDMLEIGRGLSAEEEKTHFGLWCMLSSPLLIGCNLETIPEESLKLLLNKELIAINQDKLALQAYVAKNENGVYLLVKDIKEFYGNSRAAAVYNSTDKDTTMEFSFTDINLSGNVVGRDVFEQKNLENFKNRAFKVYVPAHGTRIFTFTGEKREEQIIYEAETAYLPKYQELVNPNDFGSAYYAPDTLCSGGMKVTNLGNSENNTLEWRNVYSKNGGKYNVEIFYVCNKDVDFKIVVNGEDVETIIVRKSKKIKVKSCVVKVKLKKGINKICLVGANDLGGMPDIDKMEVRR